MGNPGKRYRICHLTTVNPALHSRIFFKECITLAEHYDVHLIGRHKRDQTIDGVIIHALPAPTTRLSRILITGPIMFIKALKVKADLYHFHSPEIIPYALVLRLFGKKIIYDVHELYAADIPEKKWLPLKGIFLGLYRFFERLACRHFFLVLAESSYADYYRKRGVRFEVVRNFVRPELFAEIAARPKIAEPRTLLMVGTPAARRGLPIIFEAMKLLRGTGVRVRFLCVGDPNKDLEKLLSESEPYTEVRDQVEFAGYIPIPQAYGRAGECFAGIALPEDLPNHRESYPTKIFEYMAVGLPVICSDFPINREVIEKYDCGICVNPANASEIADGIRYLQSSPRLSKGMGERGKAALEHDFNWSEEEEKLLEVYQNLLP